MENSFFNDYLCFIMAKYVSQWLFLKGEKISAYDLAISKGVGSKMYHDCRGFMAMCVFIDRQNVDFVVLYQNDRGVSHTTFFSA